MAAVRRSLLVGWIALALIGATAGLATRPDAPARTVTTAARPSKLTDTTLVPTTTLAPTTTTTAPPVPTTVPAPPTTAPRPKVRTTPAPRPSSAAPVTAPTGSSVAQQPAAAATPEYATQLIDETVPARWLAAIPVSFQVIPGQTSWSNFTGLIQVGDWQLTYSVPRAKFTLAHEFGHLIAWHYGTDAFNGAGPAGFPYTGQLPEEMWADCVAQAFTGTSYPTRPLGPCPADALAFTARFLASGPGTRLR